MEKYVKKKYPTKCRIQCDDVTTSSIFVFFPFSFFKKEILSLRKAQWFSVSHLFFTTCFYLFGVEEKKGYVPYV